MHYMFIAIEKEVKLPKDYVDFEKTKEFKKVRKVYCDSKHYMKFLDDIAKRVGIEDLKEYKNEIGKIVFDKEKGKVLMLKDLEKFADNDIEILVRKMLMSQRKARYYLLPLLLRPLCEGYIDKENIDYITIGFEIIVDEYDLDIDLINDLLYLFLNAKENNKEIYMYTIDTNIPYSANDIKRALPFLNSQIKSLGFKESAKLLLPFKKDK